MAPPRKLQVKVKPPGAARRVSMQCPPPADLTARCRLLAECAEAFELQVCTIRDIHAYDNTTASTGGGHGCDTSTAGSASDEGGVRIAVPSIDTVTHDLCMSQHIGSSDGAGGGGGGGNAGSGGAAAVVELYDTCVNVGTVRNGLLCAMHPSEGFWIFQGAQNRAQGGNAYGSAWHSRHHRAVGMPTSVIKVHYSDATRKGNTSHHGGGGGGGGGVGSHHSTTSAHHSATSVLSVGGTVKVRCPCAPRAFLAHT